MEVHSSKVSRWIKEILKETGVDVVFKCNSTRSASTSKACLSSISVDDILSRGSRSNESTWKRSAFKEATFSGRCTRVVWYFGALNRGRETGLQSDID